MPLDDDEAAVYRRRMREREARLSVEAQRVALEAVLEKCGLKGWRFHAGATEATHVHVVVSWREALPWLTVRTGVKGSVSRALSVRCGKRRWLSEGGSRKRVKDGEHLAHLRERYLPSHLGWGWDEASGWREPIAGR